MDRESLVRILTEQCEIGVYKRGEMYFRNGQVRNRRRRGEKIFARVRGRRNYGVSIRFDDGGVSGFCSCPYYSLGQFCKHIVAAGLAFREEEATFIDMVAMRAKIFRQEQKTLAEIMAHIVEIHPDLVDDMGMDIREPADYDSAAIVRGILGEIDPLDPREMDFTMRRLKSVLARAEIEHDRGHRAEARRIVFHLVRECLAVDERCDAAEIFPHGYVAFLFAHWKAMAAGEGADPAEAAAERAALSASPWFAREGLEEKEEKNDVKS